MMQKAVVLLLMMVAILTVAVDIPKTPKHGGQERFTKDGKKNIHFDHALILGDKKMEAEFDELSHEESRHRLELLAIKMDRNDDGFLDRDELQNWILFSIKLLDADEAHDEFRDVDKNNDSKITWAEYLGSHEKYTAEQIKALRGKKDKTKEEIKDLQDIEDDHKMFKAADINNDGFLGKEEFIAFHHPESHKHMHKILLEEFMSDYDANKDGRISLKEYLQKALEHSTEANKETDKRDETNKFNEHDDNKNGFLDSDEIPDLIYHDYDEEAAEEAHDLFAAMDPDDPNKIPINEVPDYHDLFVGSIATHQGDFLHVVSIRKDGEL